jgi:hypothetical protein
MKNQGESNMNILKISREGEPDKTIDLAPVFIFMFSEIRRSTSKPSICLERLKDWQKNKVWQGIISGLP